MFELPNPLTNKFRGGQHVRYKGEVYAVRYALFMQDTGEWQYFIGDTLDQWITHFEMNPFEISPEIRVSEDELEEVKYE